MMLLFHIFAAIAGLITSTARSIILLRVGKINGGLQKFTWSSLFVLGTTGILLALSKPLLFHDPKFLMKMFFVGALFVAEVYLTLRRSKSAISISLFTWYFSFLWSGLERLEVGYLGILGTYAGILLLIFIASKLKIPAPNF